MLSVFRNTLLGVAVAALLGAGAAGAHATDASTGGAAPVPTISSGALTLLRVVDQNLDKAESVMGPDGERFGKDYRVSDATSRLKAARDGIDTVIQRHGPRIPPGSTEVTSRQERLASLEKKLEGFSAEMGAAIQKEKDDQTAKLKAEEEAQKASRAASDAAMAKRVEEARKAETAALAGPAPGPGRIVFSKSPIDPAKPANLTTSFKAGDTIYGLIMAGKPFRELLKGRGKTELGVMVVMEVGGSETLQYITLKKPEYIDSDRLVLEIAPDPAMMTAYKNPDIVFGEGKGGRKIGPIAFTHELAQLPAGKHKVAFYVRDYGEKPAFGELEIEGTDFKFYADLHEKVKAGAVAVETLPPAGMVNKELETQMRALLENAGWTNILRLVIVDKDWWVEGNKSRYLNVAAAARGADGKCYWCNVQFTQPKLITGEWGKLELTRTGMKRPVEEKNVGR